MATNSKKLIQLEFLSLAQDRIGEVIGEFPKNADVIASKLGGKVLGLYTCCAGKAFEGFLILEFENGLDDKVEHLKTARQDPAFGKAMQATGKAINNIDVYFCRELSGTEYHRPAPDSKIILRRYDYHGSPVDALNSFKEVSSKVFEKHIAKHGLKRIATLIPSFAEHQSCYFDLWECPSNVSLDSLDYVMKGVFTDQELKPQIDEMYKHLVNVARKAYAPLC
jgi:hypothetical protein